MTTTADERTAALAQQPMRLAGPRRGFFVGTVQGIRDIVGQRELLVLLVRRELKARYKDSTLGLAWGLLRPIATLLIYYVALGKFLGAARSVPAFAVFIYTGLTAWLSLIHISEPTRRTPISYAVFCLKKKKPTK